MQRLFAIALGWALGLASVATWPSLAYESQTITRARMDAAPGENKTTEAYLTLMGGGQFRDGWRIKAVHNLDSTTWFVELERPRFRLP